MAEKVRQYVAIDAKSFYASVECVERHLNPLTTNLVVADESRTEKTICLAVSPSFPEDIAVSGKANETTVFPETHKSLKSQFLFPPTASLFRCNGCSTTRTAAA